MTAATCATLLALAGKRSIRAIIASWMVPGMTTESIFSVSENAPSAHSTAPSSMRPRTTSSM